MVHSKKYFNKIMELENQTKEETLKFALDFDSVHLCKVGWAFHNITNFII